MVLYAVRVRVLGWIKVRVIYGGRMMSAMTE